MIDANIIGQLAARVTFFIALFFAAPLVSANFNNAMKIYEAGEFERAQEAFETLAGIGDRDALFNLGVMHYRGEYFTRDPARGYALMFLAIENVNNADLTATVEKIYKSFSAQRRAAASLKIEALRPEYAFQEVQKRIFPVPLADKDCVPELRAKDRVAPRYPRAEQVRGRMGYTFMEMTVSPEGYARDITIDRSTSKYFTRESVKSAIQSRYEPPADGKPFYGHRWRFTYVLGRTKSHVTPIYTDRIKKTMSASRREAEGGDVVAQYKYARSLNELRAFDKGLKDIKLEYRDANRWFAESAKGGLPNAQFELGRNMVTGRGCEQDRENGMKWIKAAAIGGLPTAQHLLAREADLLDRTDQNNLAMMSWLRTAALSEYYPAKLQLAWELAASTTPALRDGKEALSLLTEKSETYFDKVRVLETQAAAHARMGNFGKAVKLQKKAIVEAQEYDWSIPAMADRLGLYEHEEAWVGAYY